jgi:hypothetical protein
MKILVYHAYYGCDTGCCGHRIEFYPGDELEGCFQEFEWNHAPEDPNEQKAWAKNIAHYFIKNHHPECLDTIDWDSLEVDASSYKDCCL